MVSMLEALASRRARLKEYIWVLELLSKQALTDMILILCCFAHMCHDSWMRLAAKDGEMRGDPSVFPALVAKSWKR
jgi:hypothetical protein